MVKFRFLRRIEDIVAFKKLRFKTRRFINPESYLIDESHIFVISLPATDYYYLPYFQLFQYKNVVVNFSYVNSNRFLSNILKNLSKEIVYKKYLKTIYDSSKQYVFFFDGQYTLGTEDFRQILKKNYPGCKIIFHLGDLIETKKGIMIDDIKRFCDLAVTYDHNDADKYGLVCHPDPYSVLPTRMLKSEENNNGVLFLGLAKNRSKDILSVYDILKKKGISCNFNIPDLDEKESAIRPELYGAKFTPYLEYLKKVQTAGCLLEIIQRGSRGCTFRTWEAVVYNKKLITNNPSVKEEVFYNPKFIQVIDSADDIDISWIKNEVKVDYECSSELLPSSCFEYYLDMLNGQKAE